MSSENIKLKLGELFYNKMAEKNDNDFRKSTLQNILNECCNEIGLKNGRINVKKNNNDSFSENVIIKKITIYGDVSPMDYEYTNGTPCKRKRLM
jgi:hypothetical protein